MARRIRQVNNRDKRTKTVPQKTYLTTRRLTTAARTAGRKAAAQAMITMGFVVIADNGWVIRKYSDGRIEKLEPLATKETKLHLRQL